MNHHPFDPHALRSGRDPDHVRVLFVQHLSDDTFVIEENGDISLSDGATLTLLLKQVTGRDTP